MPRETTQSRQTEPLAPRGWSAGKLGNFLELKRGYDLPASTRDPGNVPVISSSGPSGTHGRAMVKAPGVVTGRYGTIGQVYYTLQDFWPLNTTLYVRDFKGNDPRYTSYLLKTIDFHSCSDKAAVPGVNRNHLHDLQASIPPLPEQRAIAHILGTLDDKIELNRRTNETLEAMARALFKSWFVDFDPVHAKKAGRKPEGMDAQTAALFPDDFQDSEMGKIPRGWKPRTVGACATLKRGTTYDGMLVGKPGPALLGLGSIRPGGGFRGEKFKTYGGDCPAGLMLFPGDMYVSLKGATKDGEMIGSVARVPASVPSGRLTQDTVKLELADPLHSHFLYRLLLTPAYRSYCAGRAMGSAVVALSREDFS